MCFISNRWKGILPKLKNKPIKQKDNVYIYSRSLPVSMTVYNTRKCCSFRNHSRYVVATLQLLALAIYYLKKRDCISNIYHGKPHKKAKFTCTSRKPMFIMCNLCHLINDKKASKPISVWLLLQYTRKKQMQQTRQQYKCIKMGKMS